MDVHVDQAGQDEPVTQFDDFRASLWRNDAVTHLGNGAIAHDDRRGTTRSLPRTVEQLAGVDVRDVRRRRWLCHGGPGTAQSNHGSDGKRSTAHRISPV